jgi:hypothetical protein
MKRADLCFIRLGIGRITLQSSAKYLSQLCVRIDSAEPPEPLPPKLSVAASEAIGETSWESDQRFAEMRD